MWCVNTAVAQTWADPHLTEQVDDPAPVFSDKEEEELVKDSKKLHIFRSSSCNRGGPKNSKSKRRSGSSSSFREASYRSKFRAKNLSLDSTDGESKEVVSPQKSEASVKRYSSFTDNVFTKLARQYSLSRSNRKNSHIGQMTGRKNDGQDDEEGDVVFNKRERRRKIGVVENTIKSSSLEANQRPNNGIIYANKNTFSPQVQSKSMFTSVVNNLTSSDSSCSNSPTYPLPPVSPTRLQLTPSPNSHSLATTSFSASLSPDDTFRPTSLGSFLDYGPGRPTSLSSVTSSISSRTSRGSDYFSSASGTNDQHQQLTSYRMSTELPVLDESGDRSVNKGQTFGDINEEDEGVGGDIGEEECIKTEKRKQDARARKRAVFAAHDQNKDINNVDHLAPVSTVAMLANPDLSYVDRVILELLETERMYVRSLQDVLTGYLAAIRGQPDFNMFANDVDALFGNIRDVYDFNRNLLLELDKCYGDPVQVAQCFMLMNDRFKVYSEYCTHYPSSVSAMTTCMQNPAIARFFKAQQDALNHTLPLGSYLLKPVQRILKYHLLLQELVKNCDKDVEGYPIIQKALSTMTTIARRINDMKKKHEDAVHIQEIQSLLTSWQGSELTTYGELVLEGEMRLQGAKNLRQVFLFDKMILITKRNEDGYLVCKINIQCSELMVVERVENDPCAFHILLREENAAADQPGNENSPANKFKQYTLIAPCAEEKKLWTQHIKRLIIENLSVKIPNNVKQSIMRMKALRDGDAKPEIRELPRYGYSSNSLLSGHDNKSKKSLAKFGGSSTPNLLSTNLSTNNTKKNSTLNIPTNNKSRRKSETQQKKGLHLRALKKKDEVDSSDDISSDSVPNTPGRSSSGSKFSFPILRGSVGRLSTGQITTSKLALPKFKSTSPTATNTVETTSPKPETKMSPNIKSSKPETEDKKSEDSKPKADGRVVYRRHKRRTSQPITFVEKRQSMKITDEEAKAAINGEDTSLNADLEDVDSYFRPPLSPRQSVSWDIQIVDAVFERYKRESSMSVASCADDEEVKSPIIKKEEEPIVLEPIPDLESTYLTVPGDVAPSPLLSYKHSANIMDRRKSRIQVLSSDTSDNDDDHSVASHMTNGGRTIQGKENVESDGCSKASVSRLRKAKAESRRASMVIHDSDTDIETKIMMKEKAVAARRKLSIKRRERNARKASMTDRNNNANNNKATESKTQRKSIKSVYDNVPIDHAEDKVEPCTPVDHPVSVGLTTATTSVSITSTQWSPPLAPQQSCVSPPSNQSQRDQYKLKLQEMREKRLNTQKILGKDARTIPSGKVQGLITKIKKIEIELGPNIPLSPTGLLSPSDFDHSNFVFEKSNLPDQSEAIQSSLKPSCKLIHSTTFDPTISHSTNTVTTTITTSATVSVVVPIVTSSIASTSHVPMKETNLSQGVPIKQSEEKFDEKVDNRTSMVTTISLPLTLTSGSSSESSDKEESLVKKVNRLSRGESFKMDIPAKKEENEDTAKKSKEIFLTRSVSIENGSKNRRSRNLVLEAKLSIDENDDTIPKNDTINNFLSSEVPLELPHDKQSSSTLEEAKLFLFEKLCSVKPDFKTTDHLSEEVDNVWSDQEKTIQRSTFNSSAFSSGEDSINTIRCKSPDIKPALPVSPLVHSKSKPIEAAVEKKQECKGKHSTKQDEIVNKKPTHVPVIIPARNESMRSTRSEMMQRRLQVANSEIQTRGRSLRSTTSNRGAIPRDVKLIPQCNVHKLAEKFNRNATTSEVELIVSRNIPRRSRSVGHTLGRRKKPLSRLGDSALASKGKDEEKKTVASAKATCKVTPLHSATVRDPIIKKQDFDEEKVVDQQIGINKHEKSNTNNKVVTVEQGDGTVLVSLKDKKPKVSNKDNVAENKPRIITKKISLVEMFAANPHNTPEEEQRNISDNEEDDCFKSTKEDTPKQKTFRYSKLFAKDSVDDAVVPSTKKQDEDRVTSPGFENNTFYFGRRRYGSTSDSPTPKSLLQGDIKLPHRLSVGNNPPSVVENHLVPSLRRSHTNSSIECVKSRRRGLILSETQEINFETNCNS